MRRALVLFAEVLLGLFLLAAPVRADFDSGLMAYASGDFDTAAREFSVLAKGGDKEGQYYMGLLYEEGQGVPQRFDHAEKCYTKAAQQGYLDAYFALGEMYLHQPGDKKDRVSAYYWLEMAAKHGHPRGMDEFLRNKKAMTPEQISLAKKVLMSQP
jgi:TPR repeat protein